MSFLRNAQAEEKEEMSYFCIRPLQTDMRRHRCRRGWSGGPAGAAPPPPLPRPQPTRQLRHPCGWHQPWGVTTQGLIPSEDQIPPAKDLIPPGKDILLPSQTEPQGHQAPATNAIAPAPTTLRVGPQPCSQHPDRRVGWIPLNISKAIAPCAAGG